MIATAALAAYLFAEADFLRSGRRKATGGVLDGRGARRPVDYKSAFHVQSVHEWRKVGGINRYVMREMKFIV